MPSLPTDAQTRISNDFRNHKNKLRQILLLIKSLILLAVSDKATRAKFQKLKANEVQCSNDEPYRGSDGGYDRSSLLVKGKLKGFDGY